MVWFEFDKNFQKNQTNLIKYDRFLNQTNPFTPLYINLHLEVGGNPGAGMSCNKTMLKIFIMLTSQIKITEDSKKHQLGKTHIC